jgi:putative transposase
LSEAATPRKRGEFELPPVDENGVPLTSAQEKALAKDQAAHELAKIRGRYTRRMHDLGEFMKSLLERFTKWFNKTHERSGTLWEERYKSVIVEDGTAARMTAAYIDLNPVRAAMVTDPAEYRWSSYGEAIGGGKKGNGKKAREGLVRAWFSQEGVGFEAERWREVARLYRRMLGIALGKKPGQARVEKPDQQVTKTDEELLASSDNETALQDLGVAKMLRCRVRYFTDGVVIGSRGFVEDVFQQMRERFGAQRRTGARKLRGAGAAAAGMIWSVRDLRKEVC